MREVAVIRERDTQESQPEQSERHQKQLERGRDQKDPDERDEVDDHERNRLAKGDPVLGVDGDPLQQRDLDGR